MQGEAPSVAGARRYARMRWALAIVASALSCLGLGAGSAAAACLNEAFRLGPSALLPECRAYEMVSPVDKNGAGVNLAVEPRTRPDGKAINFWSAGDFAGAPSRLAFSNYIARRGEDNWHTESVVPPFTNIGTILIKAAITSPDQSKTLQASNHALTPDAVDGASNLYLLDNLTGERKLVASTPDSQLLFDFTNINKDPGYASGTDDWSHIAFFSSAGLLGAPKSQVLYEIAGGELRIASRLPDETPSAAHIKINNTPTPYTNMVSEDGSRIFWVAGAGTGAGVVYMRENGEKTIPITASQKTGEEGTLKTANFGAANEDGSVVYLIGGNMTDEAATGNSLLRYDVETGELTDLLAGMGANNPQVQRVITVSEDGSYVYFSARGAITPDSAATGTQGANFFVWHDGEVDLIATMTNKSRETAGPVGSMTSRNGVHLAFATKEPLAPDDVPSENCPGTSTSNFNCKDVYYYNAVTKQLSCLTCTGTPPLGESNIGGADFREAGIGDNWVRPVLDDGTVFFNTPNALVLNDVNGVGDVYGWRQGARYLLSTGTDPTESNFGDVTPDGSTVFIRTAESLVPQDVDGSIDLYAVRVEGGFAAQHQPPPPPPCEGEACRGASPSARAWTPPVSTGGAQDENVPAACVALERRARAAERQAASLGRRAAAAGRRAKARKGRARAGALKKSRALRRQAQQQRRKATALFNQAHNCGGQG